MMVLSAVGVVLGFTVSGGGLYFMATEDEDTVTRAVNITMAAAGAVVGVASLLYYLTHLV